MRGSVPPSPLPFSVVSEFEKRTNTPTKSREEKAVAIGEYLPKSSIPSLSSHSRLELEVCVFVQSPFSKL